jgi:hypothetical protein
MSDRLCHDCQQLFQLSGYSLQATGFPTAKVASSQRSSPKEKIYISSGHKLFRPECRAEVCLYENPPRAL